MKSCHLCHDGATRFWLMKATTRVSLKNKREQKRKATRLVRLVIHFQNLIRKNPANSTMTEVQPPPRPDGSISTPMPETLDNKITKDSKRDELWTEMREEALKVLKNEPELGTLLHRTVLAPRVASLEDAVASTVCYRLLLQPCNKSNLNASNGGPSAMFCPDSLKQLIRDCISSEFLEMDHTMSHAIREDAKAVVRRDPATDSVLQVVLFSKGYAALVCHRAAHRLWLEKKRTYTALFLQSQASAVFGLDIHPLARMGCNIMLDHGTGLVVGETATVGDGCTILHGVTLGGTGKDHGDRHPKVGPNVLIGAGSSLLGNIKIGKGAKIGAGSVVLRCIPPGATAVGAPAKIIGRSVESRPGSEMDETLEHVSLLHKSSSSSTVATTSLSETDEFSGSEEEVLGGESSGANKEPDSSSSSNIRESVSSMCPYREYTHMAKRAPKHAITICSLQKLLKPHGCTSNEIGACLFALDTRNVGYCTLDVFAAHAVEVISASTCLGVNEVESLVAGFLESQGGADLRSVGTY